MKVIYAESPYRIVRDERNYILEREHTTTKKDGQKVEGFMTLGYFGTLEQALIEIFRAEVDETKKASTAGVIAAIRKAEKKIREIAKKVTDEN